MPIIWHTDSLKMSLATSWSILKYFNTYVYTIKFYFILILKLSSIGVLGCKMTKIKLVKMGDKIPYSLTY